MEDTEFVDPMKRKERWKCCICNSLLSGNCKRCPICGNKHEWNKNNKKKTHIK